MGLFDVFTTTDQKNAANDQISGINTGLNALTSDFTQGQNAIKGSYAQGADALTSNYGAGADALKSNYAQGQNALTSTYGSALQPYLTNYGNANAGVTQLANVLGLNGAAGSDAALKTLQNTPGYQFQLQQGNNAITAADAASGKTASGNEAIALANYNQGLAGTTYNNYVSQLQPYLTQASNAASGIGNTYTGLGTALNNSSTSLGNALNTSSQNLGTQLNASSQGVGNALNSSYQTLGNANYGADTSIGNANANADLSGLTASANTLGTAVGLGKSLLGFLSDKDAKDDIEPVGELYDGQKVYRYRYKGDPRHQIGLIAQEVEERAPDAIVDMGPLKGVDYKRATNFAADLARFAA